MGRLQGRTERHKYRLFMQKRVLIHRGDGDIRAAFLEDGKLVEFHREKLEQRSIVGNIYRGVVQDVIPGLQAAFIDCGTNRNMFLDFMDVRPEAKVLLAENLDEALHEASKVVLPGRIQVKGRRPRPDLRAGVTEAPVKRGDTIIVQVLKAEISEKAPRVTTNVSLAGRYLVLLPYPSQTGGVSRKVALGQERMKLKKLLNELRTDRYSFIVRTAGMNATEEQIRADVERLREQWDTILSKFRGLDGPGLVHSDQEIVQRLVRDAFSDDITDVLCDDPEIAAGLREELSDYLPELARNVHDYTDLEPMFERYLVEPQFRKALHRKVWLKSGGSIVIDENEALTSIDINTGKFTGSGTQERTSLRTNIEAAEEIAAQIRLRDIGGIIVVDFIDMDAADSRAKVEAEFRKHLKEDRAKMSVSGIGDFGLMVLTRKRKNVSLLNQIFDECPYCKGEGFILKPEEIWRRIRNDLAIMCQDIQKYSAVVVSCEPAVAEALQGAFASYVEGFSRDYHVDIIVRGEPGLHREDFSLTGIERPEKISVPLPVASTGTHEAFRAIPKWQRTSAASIPPPAPAARKPRTETPKASPSPAPAETSAAEDPGEGDAARKRTRRGRRGGRRRRRPEEGVDNIDQTLETPHTEALDDEPEEEIVETPEVPAEAEEPKTPAPVAAKAAPKAAAKTAAKTPPSPPPASTGGPHPKVTNVQILTPYWAGRAGLGAPEQADEEPAAVGRATLPRKFGNANRQKFLSFQEMLAKTASGREEPKAPTPVGPPKAVQIVSSWGTLPGSQPAEAEEKPAAKKSSRGRRGGRGRKSAAAREAAEASAAQAPAAPKPAEPAAKEEAPTARKRSTTRAAKKAAKAAKKAAAGDGAKKAAAPAKSETSAAKNAAARKSARKAAAKKASAPKAATKKAASASASTPSPAAKKSAKAAKKTATSSTKKAAKKTAKKASKKSAKK